MLARRRQAALAEVRAVCGLLARLVTAWALLGLMAAGETDHPAVARGIADPDGDARRRWLLERAALYRHSFPRVFYLRYHGYAKFFPLWVR